MGPVMGFAPAVEDKAAAAAEFAKVVDTWFEHFCKGTDFVSGNSPTIADYYMAPFFVRGNAARRGGEVRIHAFGAICCLRGQILQDREEFEPPFRRRQCPSRTSLLRRREKTSPCVRHCPFFRAYNVRNMVGQKFILAPLSVRSALSVALKEESGELQ